MASEANSRNTSRNTARKTLFVLTFNSKNVFNTFTRQVMLKLYENNQIKQKIEGIIRMHQLHRLLVSLTISPHHITK